MSHDGLPRVGGNQGRSVLADHDRIDYQGKCESRGGIGDGFHDGATAERSRLGGGWRNVVENGIQLLEDKLRRQALDTIYALSVLHGEQREDGFAVDSELMKRFEVSLDA